MKTVSNIEQVKFGPPNRLFIAGVFLYIPLLILLILNYPCV